MISFEITFNDCASDPACGKIGFKVIKAETASDLSRHIYIEITDPNSNVIKVEPSVAAADFQISGTAASEEEKNLVDIPLIANGNTFKGQYKFVVKMVNSNATSEVETMTLLYDYCPSVTEASLETSVSCDDRKVSASDDTDYGDYTITERVLKIQPPTIPNSTMVTAQSSSNMAVLPIDHDFITVSASLQTKFQKSTAVTGTSTFENIDPQTTIVSGATFIDKLEVTASKDATVQCSGNSCAIGDAAYDEIKRLEAKACSSGGYSSLEKYEKDKLFDLIAHLGVLSALDSCSDSEDRSAVVTKLNALLSLSSNSTVAAPTPFTTTNNLIVQQTAWQKIETNDQFENVELYNNNVELHPFYYRRLGTNHLEIYGVFKVTTGSNLPFIVLRDFFTGEFAPSNDFTQRFNRSNAIQILAFNPGLVNNASFNMLAYLSDPSKTGSWDLLFHGQHNQNDIVQVHGIFAL